MTKHDGGGGGGSKMPKISMMSFMDGPYSGSIFKITLPSLDLVVMEGQLKKKSSHLACSNVNED